MTFTFKLARRLAVLRFSLLIGFALLNGSCAPPEPLSDGFEPPPIDEPLSIHIVPDSVLLDTTSSVNFEADATMPNGTSVGGIPVAWECTGGTITSNGRYTAGRFRGRWWVIGRHTSGKSDTAIVVIEPTAPTLTGVRVTPASAAVVPGGSQAFSAQGVMSDGGTSSVAVNWTATGGSISGGGAYTAGTTPGSYRVIATQQGGTFADTSAVTVTDPPATLTAVELTPASASLEYTQTRQFTAIGRLSDGSTSSIAITWTATGGTVSSSGLYRAGNNPGSFRVIAASANGLADTSSVTVSAPTVTALSVTPTSATLQSSATQQFSVSATLSNGTSQSNPSVTWSATGGSISTGGLYTAGATTGSFQVIAASANGVADTSSITISAATITAITVTPPTASLQGGQTQQFSASATMSNGTTQPNPSVTWIATGGTVNGSGLYTAGTTGGSFGVVAVSGNGRADTSTVTITVPAPTITAVTVTPATASVATGQTQQFSATATMSNGTTQTNPSLTWTATGGTISTGRLYTAGLVPGSYRVVATSANGFADTSAVTVSLPTIIGLTLTPGSVTLQTGQNQQFNVVANLLGGGTQSNPTVTWSSTGGNVTTGGLYTAGSSTGSFRVVTTLVGGLIADTSSVTITTTVPSSTYFNSSEAGCGSDSNVIWCDDFERGKWFVTTADVTNPQNAGWNGTPYGSSDPQGTNFGRCGGTGVGGTTCAATNGGHTGIGQARAMADHDLSSTTSDIYFRYYVKPLPGYSFGQEKALTFNKGPAGVGGIFFGTMFFGTSSGSSSAAPHFYAVNQGTNLTQNQGSLSMTGGNWYFIELHLKLNGAGSDLVEMWMDNCGANGLGCSGSPTLRMRYTNATLRPGGDNSSTFRSIWLENWANPASTGEMLYDQIKVSKVGPVGFKP